MTVLPAIQAELAEATNRLLTTAAALSPGDVAAPSRLPGWTRGHVLAHVAGNADSHLRLLTWARTGVRTPQYAGPEARAAEIERNATRSPAEHLAAVEDGAARLAQAVRDMPEEGWRTMVTPMRPPSHPAWYCLVRRLREVGMHRVDLDAGFTPADWSASFVRRELHACRICWPYGQATVSEIRIDGGETWTDLGEGPVVAGGAAEVLAWLTGRSDGDGVSVVPEGRLPSAPPWLTMPAPDALTATPPKDYP
ncbi:maleylpyruvate isomerase family mycothiol-dependent enzyme [Nonomuraea sp. NPDC050536]|uniref:maleylpyruvate isomerase family mycothiol-dependent enzyme n=1 Tax=Nonomuraea sp. NPDC050536 TaxID=3364366 RepID=UPI0037CA8CE9